jgi:hypothetical protein
LRYKIWGKGRGNSALRTIAEKLCGKEKVEEVAKVGSVKYKGDVFEFPGSFPTNVSPVARSVTWTSRFIVLVVLLSMVQ